MWRAVNACILFLPMIHGKALLTVESLGQCDALNPLQACMAGNGSSQCGFCTPGFVMSLYGRSIGACGSGLPVADVIAGNLCRCTGYGPILAAGEAVATLERDDAALVAALKALASDETVSGRLGERRWFLPKTSDALAALLAEYPDARLVAGATDVGLWVTKGLRTLETLIFVGDIAELQGLEETDDALTIGAGVRLCGCARGFRPAPPRSWRADPPHRRVAGAQCRDGRRQYRQWLAHRRRPACADRARRRTDSAQRGGAADHEA